MSERNCAVILAGGEGKRMKRNRPKCLSPVLFKPMLQWVIDSAQGAEAGSVCVVTGFLNAQVDPGAVPVFQTERKGTGHAVMTAAGFLRERAAGGNALTLNGDAPFLNSKTIRKTLAEHRKNGNSVKVISALLEDPAGYGRVIRAGGDGALRAIVERKDASTGELAVCDVKPGSVLDSVRGAGRSVKTCLYAGLSEAQPESAT